MDTPRWPVDTRGVRVLGRHSCADGGPDLERLQPSGEVVITPHPGDGVWFESVIADQIDGAWYAYYHHEVPAHACGRLDRTRDEAFNSEGSYVSFAATLGDPAAWSAPRKILDGGGWYPQVAGSEPGTGTDKQMGRRARFFLTGRSTRYIEFIGQ